MRSLTVIFLRASLFSFLGLSACLPHGMPEITMSESPAGPFVSAVEQRKASMAALKGIAEVSWQRKDRKRSFDTVGILLEPQKRLRVEAYGPFGESLLAIVWNGKDEAFIASGGAVMNSGRIGLERLLGKGVGIADLSALLSGNAPDLDNLSGAKAYCGNDGVCVLETGISDKVQRIWFVQDAAAQPVMSSFEIYRDGSLVYRARFEDVRTFPDYRMPMLITIEEPAGGNALTVKYSEVELNPEISDDSFGSRNSEAAGQ